MLTSLLILLVAYLLGSLSGSLLLGRLRGVDIRVHGSGNAGGTNALRTLGWRFALGVVAIDIGKGALAAWLALRWAPFDGPLAIPTLGYLAGLMAIAGHTWPVFFGFRGGKGAAALVGALLVLWPTALPWLIGLWLLVIGLSGYVGLATMLATASLLPQALWAGGAARFGFALVAAAFIVFTHRGNIARLRAGTEARFERARILARPFRRRA
jgi:glycerol-3-phosphate acyltransferase PlsY